MLADNWISCRWMNFAHKLRNNVSVLKRAVRASLSEIVGDVKQLHSSRSSAGHSSKLLRSSTCWRWFHLVLHQSKGWHLRTRRHSRPACAIACGAARSIGTISTSIDGQLGQTANHKSTACEMYGAELGNSDRSLWKMQNGYALPSLDGLTKIDASLKTLSEAGRDHLRSKLKMASSEIHR